MSRKIAFSGIFTGVSLILIYMAAIMPTGKVTLYFLASLPVAFAIIEFGKSAGIALYFAVCILSALTVGNFYGIVPYALFFGHYPIFKCYIENGRGAVSEVLLKLAVFNTSGLLGYLLFKGLFLAELPIRFINNGYMTAVFFLVMQLAFFIYDYVFSRLVFYYEARLSLNNRK